MINNSKHFLVHDLTNYLCFLGSCSDIFYRLEIVISGDGIQLNGNLLMTVDNLTHPSRGHKKCLIYRRMGNVKTEQKISTVV